MTKISLEDISESEIPVLENEIDKKIRYDYICYWANQSLDSYRYGEFQNLRLLERDKEIGRKIYGIGTEQKTIKELEEEYNEPGQRWNRTYIRDIKKRIDRALMSNLKKLFE